MLQGFMQPPNFCCKKAENLFTKIFLRHHCKTLFQGLPCLLCIDSEEIGTLICDQYRLNQLTQAHVDPKSMGAIRWSPFPLDNYAQKLNPSSIQLILYWI